MEKVEHSKIREIVIQFIQKFRVVLVGLLVLIVAGIVVAIVYEEVNKNSVSSVSAMVEKLDGSYSSLLSAKDDTEKLTLQTDFDAVVKQTNDSFKGTFAQQKSLFLQATIFFDSKKFVEAEQAFVTCAAILPDSYLAPVALLNASFSAEENNQIDKSFEYLNKIVKTYTKSSAVVSRALFNIGRLSELNQKWTEAKDAYQKIIESAPTSNWTKLAKDRIIYLKAQNRL